MRNKQRFLALLIFLFSSVAIAAASTFWNDVIVWGNLYLSSLTANTVPYLDSNSKFVSSSVTPTQLGTLATGIPLATGVSGVLPIANGGTNNGSLSATLGGVLYTDGSKVVNVGAGTTGQALKSNGAAPPTWGAVAGSGTKNYLSAYTASLSSNTVNTGNGDAELGAATGFVLGHVATITNGLPSGAITFGSGASGNLSLTATNTNPLSGNYSFSYASSAATTAGDFISSVPFFIDSSDQGKVLTWSFSYQATTGSANANFSGTSSNSYAVAIWDVGNSVFIGSTGNFNLVQGSGVGKATGTFQTNTTTSQYRIVIYNATATSGAATMYFDDLVVGPQVSPNAPAMSDWVAYTPIYTNLGAVTTTEAFWMRVGSNLYIKGKFTAGTGAGTAMNIGIPTGLTISSTSELSTAITGTIGSGTGTATYYPLITGGSTGVQAGSQTGGTTFTPALGTSFSALVVSYMVGPIPIQGWSSNTVSSSDTDTRVVIAAADTLSSTTVTANTAVGFTHISTDTHGGFSGSGSTFKYTVPISGYYTVNLVSVSNSVGSGQSYVAKNGSFSTSTGVNYLGTPNASTSSSGSNTASYNAGDTIQIANGGSITASTEWSLSIQRVSGPAVITATESVAMQVTTVATLSATSGSALVFTTVEKDTHNKYSAGTYTIPVSGWYKVGFAGMLTTATIVNFTLFKNGSAYRKISGVPTTTANAIGSGTVGIQCNTGDALTLVPDGTTILLYSAGLYQPTWIIERQGN